MFKNWYKITEITYRHATSVIALPIQWQNKWLSHFLFPFYNQFSILGTIMVIYRNSFHVMTPMYKYLQIWSFWQNINVNEMNVTIEFYALKVTLNQSHCRNTNFDFDHFFISPLSTHSTAMTPWSSLPVGPGCEAPISLRSTPAFTSGSSPSGVGRGFPTGPCASLTAVELSVDSCSGWCPTSRVYAGEFRPWTPDACCIKQTRRGCASDHTPIRTGKGLPQDGK